MNSNCHDNFQWISPYLWMMGLRTLAARRLDQELCHAGAGIEGRHGGSGSGVAGRSWWR